MKYKETKIGIVPEHWEILPIKDITEVVTDYVANGSFASLAENVTYKDEEDVAVLIRLVDYNNNFQGKFVFIDEHAYEFLGKSKLFGAEIIVSNVGANVGTVFRCPKLQYKMSLAPNSIMVKFKGNDDFYFHWLRGHNGQQMLKSIVTGSAQPKFNKTNFKEMLAPVPPIEEQNKIASILNSLDEKIELNKKINNNLEQQAMLTNEEVIEEMLKLAKQIAAAQKEGDELGLTTDELAFYDALTKPQAIKDFYENDELIAITKELTDTLRKNKTIDWQKRESARAKMRMLIKKLLKKHKYPPEGMEDAVQTVMTQCELWTDNMEM